MTTMTLHETKTADLPYQLDITAPRLVEIALSADRRTLWLNIDGVCATRVSKIDQLTIDDRLKEDAPEPLTTGVPTEAGNAPAESGSSKE